MKILEHAPAKETLEEVLILGLDGLVEGPESGEYEAGRLALVGEALEQLGKRWKEAAKAEIEPQLERGKATDFEVKFEVREASKSLRVDSEKVKEQLPHNMFPQYYKTVQVAGSTSITIPRYLKE